MHIPVYTRINMDINLQIIICMYTYIYIYVCRQKHVSILHVAPRPSDRFLGVTADVWRNLEGLSDCMHEAQMWRMAVLSLQALPLDRPDEGTKIEREREKTWRVYMYPWHFTGTSAVRVPPPLRGFHVQTPDD